MDQHVVGIEDCDAAIRLDPGNASAYFNRGIAKVKLSES